MNQTSETLRPGVIINETIDGIAMVAPREKKRSAAAAIARPKPDHYIWGIYIMLLVISVVELFSASSTEVSGHNVYMPLIRHGIFLVVGFVIILALQNIHYGFFSKFAWFLAIVSLGLLFISNLFGVEINGAQRAINIAGFTIQPAEIVKLTVVVLLATILGRNQEPRGVTTKGMWEAAIVVIVFGGCLWKNGLTNTILLFGVCLSMFLIGGMKWKKLGIILLLYCALGGILYIFKYQSDKGSEFENLSRTEQVADNGGGRAETHKGRISRFFAGVSPEDPIDDYNRQVVFAKISQANGGILGQGPGNSRESARLPLAFSDYIYSIIVEDTGFVGGVALLILYLFLLARAGRIAYKCSRAFPAFLIMGCAVLIVFQALVHMAIVTGLFPVSGQPLPLISKGGTSILVMSAAIGIMLSVSRFAVTNGNKQAIKEELRELPEDMKAANYSGINNDTTK
ncbi:MAG: FtsW/RodA/SpoVE family cell cycle protein [Muribaculaceae bacterium]|nr:FtsW/RodA/SpoVE family cell cycle protein [Muribaculaceae bacterium]MDE6754668.1 FtsW/RodA/SpoVE family cell cycle protein [Muribaculaceae bacterium]